MRYDIIGDIHGEYDTLVALLDKLGYQKVAGVWQHSEKQAIFLGDFIDRGLKQKAVLDLVMPMVQQGKALAVMGNHEFNALAFHTESGKNEWLRPRTNKNIKQHLAFLCEYLGPKVDNSELEKARAFFRTLPLWLELDGLRIVHACWHPESLDIIRESCPNGLITETFLHSASTEGTNDYKALEIILKGLEIHLPGNGLFTDKDGNPRSAIRLRWWDATADTYREAYNGPEEARVNIPDDPIDGDYAFTYGYHEPPVFMGHYWFQGAPEVLAHNVACVDYSVAKPEGKLVAYQWSGEQSLINDRFIWVKRLES